MSPTGELIDTETVTISSEGGGWKRTQPVIRKDIRTPAQAVPRRPPTLRPVRFGGGRMEKDAAGYPSRLMQTGSRTPASDGTSPAAYPTRIVGSLKPFRGTLRVTNPVR